MRASASSVSLREVVRPAARSAASCRIVGLAIGLLTCRGSSPGRRPPPGSARVEVSPRLPKSFSAILRRMRRMILPERVLGRPGAHWITSGVAIGPISLRTQADQLLAQLLGRLLAGLQRHVGVDALALDVVRVADHGGLGDLGVADQRALDLGGAEAVAGDVDHVVDAAGDPVVAVLVAARAVAGEVLAGIGREVGLDEALRGRRRPCASGRARS